MYPSIYRAMRLFWPGGLETRRHLNELEYTQRLSREELRAFQLARLRGLVKHAYERVPFYRERYRREGIHPDDIQSLEDFHALPFVNKEDIRANLDSMIAQGFPKADLVPNHTGGSTGEPLHFFVGRSFWWWNAANEFRMRRWHGIREGERTAWIWGDQRDMPDWSWRRRLRARIMNQRFLNAFSLTRPKMEAFADMLVLWQPRLIIGYSTALFLFAQFLKGEGIDSIRPRLVEATAEKLWKPQRDLIEEVFHCPVVNHYSSREMGTMAYECEQGALHALDDVRYMEVISDGEAAKPGELGEVVVTSFNHLAMPFIRYKNDDVAIRSDERCACGRGLSVIKEIVGRSNDYLVTSEGQFVHSEFFAYLLRARPEVFSYQVYQPDKRHLNIKIVCRQRVDPTWLDDVRRAIRSRFGDPMHISVELVSDIELTPAGKHRYIISEVRPDFV